MSIYSTTKIITSDIASKILLVSYVAFSGANPGFPVGGGADPRGGAPKYDFAEFSTKKLHEIKKILGRRGARAGGPPLDPPLILNIKDPSNNLPVQQNTCW